MMEEKNLEILALEKKMSIRDLAKLVGVTEVTMWRYVHRSRIPSIPIAAAIADALDIDWREVIDLCKEEEG